MAKSEEELKSLLMKVKEEIEKMIRNLGLMTLVWQHSIILIFYHTPAYCHPAYLTYMQSTS